MVATFVPLGINNVTNKFFPQFNDPEKKHHGYLGFSIGITLIGLIFCFLLLWLTKNYVISVYQTKSKLFTEYYNYVFPLIAFFSITITLTTYLFVRLKTTVPPFINDVVMRIFIIGLVTVYHFQLLDLQQFIFCFVTLYFIQILLLLGYLYHVEKPGWKIDWTFFNSQPLRAMFGYGVVLWTGSLAVIGLKELSTVMLARFMSLEYVAIYAIAAFIPTVIEAPMGALEKIAAPKISYAWNENNKHEISEIYHKSVKYLLLIGGLLFVGININISSLLSFLPPKYSEGTIVVLIISISSLFNMATGLNNSILLISNRYRPGAALLVILVILNFILQLILIPRYGLIGAAIATATAQIIFNVTNYILVWKFFHLQPFDKSTGIILILILSCFLLNSILPTIYLPALDIFYRSAVITLLYSGAVIYFKLVPELYAYLPWNKMNNKK
jgi:O-antigen/teichoic acid export membrane protein